MKCVSPYSSSIMCWNCGSVRTSVEGCPEAEAVEASRAPPASSAQRVWLSFIHR